MNKKIGIFKDDSDQIVSYLFNIECYDENNNTIQVGNYSIDENGCLLGEVDESLLLYNKDFISKAKIIMIESGLKEIIGKDLEEKKFFSDDFNNTSLNIKLSLNLNKDRWNRALEYIKTNNLSISDLKLDKYKK